MENIYIVSSFTNTLPGQMIKLRGAMKFWNRYPGDEYSHISLSRDNILNNMMSFARKEVNNPFNSGLVKENIREGTFKLNADKSKIAVMEIKVTEEQYNNICKNMTKYWLMRDELKFNFAGLATMLLYGKGVAPKNNFFCSQWVATVLKECGIDFFDDEMPHNIRPFDFYSALREQIIYEGSILKYPKYNDVEEKEIETENVLTLSNRQVV